MSSSTCDTMPADANGNIDTESWTYNADGTINTHTDFEGVTAEYSYDDQGRLAEINWPALETFEEYGYDALGRPNYYRQIYGHGLNFEKTTTYDPITGEASVVTSLVGGDDYRDIHYVYDPATGEHTETYTEAYVEGVETDNKITDTLYGYDAQGRLTTVTTTMLNGQTLATPLVTRYTYDAVGNKTSETLPDSEVTTYTYDDLNRLTGVSETQGTTTVFSQSYILNDDGTRASSDESQEQSNGSTVSWYTAWTYDADQRLTNETVTSTGTPSRDYSDTFAYDLNSNRISETYTDADASKDNTTTSTYDDRDQLTSEVSTLNGETDFTYDSDGNQITSTTGTDETRYGYDAFGKMSFVVHPDGTSVSYVYDDNGNRVSEATGGIPTFYLIDDENPSGYAQPIEAWTYLNDTYHTPLQQMTYLTGDHVYGQADASGNVSYLLTDGHGSTQQLTNATGVVSQTYAYTAFGNSIGFDPNTAATTYLFGGDGVYDPASQLYFHGGGRPTDSDTGESIQEDLEGYGDNSDPITLHKYLYAGANPISNIDPSGHDLFELLGTLAIQGLVNGLRLGAYGTAIGAGLGGIDAALGGQSIIQGAIGGAKFGGTIGFSIGFLGPFATTFLAPSVITGLANFAAGASLALGAYGSEQAYVDGHTAQSIFRIGLGVLGYSLFRPIATTPLLPVNIGGEGEVPNVINLQPLSALGKDFGRATDGRSLAGMIRDGNQFLIYNANTGVLPFESNSVPKVITNSVPIDTPPGGFFKPISSAEIVRVLKPGGQWIRDGSVVYTKPQ